MMTKYLPILTAASGLDPKQGLIGKLDFLIFELNETKPHAWDGFETCLGS
jgi:hypothetical protein